MMSAFFANLLGALLFAALIGLVTWALYPFYTPQLGNYVLGVSGAGLLLAFLVSWLREGRSDGE
jgi:hypothetical protein